MGVWAAYVGKGDSQVLRGLLGPDAPMRVGPGYGLGVTSGMPAISHLASQPGVVATASGANGDDGSRAVIVTRDFPKLTLQADPFGIHGAYAARTPGCVWASSCLKALSLLPGTPKTLDPIGLHGYLCFSYVPAPLTIFRGISALTAGESATFTPDGGEVTGEGGTSWREAPPPPIEEAALVAELRERLSVAVARRAGNKREIGVFLSGGIDSSFIAALLADLGVRVHLYTLDFGPPFDAEVPYAQRVAAHLERPLNVVPARHAHVQAALEKTAAALDQPFGDAVTVPLYLLGRAAAEQVDTVFNGEGGDQLFGGWANKPMIAAELYGGPGYQRETAYLNTFHRFHGLTSQLYTRQAQETLGTVDAGGWVRPFLNTRAFTSLLHRLRAANLWMKGAQNIAPRAAQLAEAHGLRLFMPFFDRSLTEWTFGLGAQWFLHGACEKYLLKRAAESLLPAEVVWREKRGMGVPVTEWCTGPLRREVARRLSSVRLRRDGWFQPAFVAGLSRRVDESGEYRRRRAGEKVWALLMLHAWCDAHGQSMPEVSGAAS